MQTPRRAAWALLALASAAALACGAWLLAADHGQSQAYARLAESSPATDPGTDSWEELSGVNADVAAWLTVGGTSVNVPVCQATADDPDYYLHHDLWGNGVEVGNPYLDARCDAASPEMTVYGHHTMVESYMFHDLSGCFRQEAFDRLGDATWSAPGADCATLHPLCSSKVDRGDQTWQRFGPMADAERCAWLTAGCEASDAKAADWQALCGSARRVLVLVTCSGWQRFGWDARTVTVFVG